MMHRAAIEALLNRAERTLASRVPVGFRVPGLTWEHYLRRAP